MAKITLAEQLSNRDKDKKISQGAENIAIEMIKKGNDDDTIMILTGLPIEHIKTLRQMKDYL